MYKRCTSDLPAIYTESEARHVLRLLNAGNRALVGLGWREIEALFDHRIIFATLAAYARGRSVVDREHKRILRIRPASVPRAERPPTKEIRLDDWRSAALSILESSATSEYITQLGEALLIGDPPERIK